MRSTSLTSALFLLATGIARADAPPDPEVVRAAVGRALPLLLKGARGHVEQRTCFACHNQAVPMLAFTTARLRDFAGPRDDLKKQAEHIATFLAKNADNYRQGKGQGGQVDTAGYALFTLDLAGWRPDATTEAVAEYLLLTEKDRDHWRARSDRPPSEASDFTTTFVALRGLRAFASMAQKERAARRADTVRRWLLGAKAVDTEGRVFRLGGLQECGAAEQDVRVAAADLLGTQRNDGGWPQTDAMDSDAYATGSALVALHQAGALTTGDAAYHRGLGYLLRTQCKDGSWRVRSRSKPFQAYYESGFPHGKDQFISMAASAWATTALALALPPAQGLTVRERSIPRGAEPGQRAKGKP